MGTKSLDTQHMRRPEEWRGGGGWYYEVLRKHVLNVKKTKQE